MYNFYYKYDMIKTAIEPLNLLSDCQSRIYDFGALGTHIWVPLFSQFPFYNF